MSVSRLIIAVEGMFNCVVGEQRAYFEFSGPKGELRRGIYEVMGFGALVELGDIRTDHGPALCEMALGVFAQLKSAGATRIVWRHGTRIELMREHSCDHKGDLQHLYARFCALDPDGNQISIPPAFFKQEGHAFRIVTREEIEDLMTSRPPTGDKVG